MRSDLAATVDAAPVDGAPVDAAPVSAAEGKPSGVALARDVEMSSSGEQPGETDPLRQLPPSHPLYRGPRRGGGEGSGNGGGVC